MINRRAVNVKKINNATNHSPAFHKTNRSANKLLGCFPINQILIWFDQIVSTIKIYLIIWIIISKIYKNKKRQITEFAVVLSLAIKDENVWQEKLTGSLLTVTLPSIQSSFSRETASPLPKVFSSFQHFF